VDPTANAFERLGWCYFRLSYFDKSIDAYRDAVKIDPTHWQSQNGIGVNALNTWLLSKKQDKDALNEAKAAFRKSLQINANQPKLIELMTNFQM
ncbi:MAG TPA: tetratricopeptide repeat protein, partial [Phycisphaerales bacterium]|nr:tetratricopeptide repeat protein [Phycisphaerales bacterium]